MPEPVTRVHDDSAALATAVAAELLATLARLQGDGTDPQVGLTGGTIARLVHREVARLTPGSGVDWGRVTVWWGDERFVDSRSDERNVRQAHEDLLDHVDVDPARVHEPAGSDQVATAEESAAAYGDAVRAHGSGGLDVLMLGVGPDGHVASLFPGFPQLDVDDAVAVAVHDSPKPPPDRVSLTFGALNRSRAVWFLVSGEEKARAVAAALSGSAPVHETPAAGVTGTDETVWWLDRTSASRLP